MNPLQITRGVRGLNRMRTVARVLTRHGFGHIVAQLNLARLVPVWMLGKRRHRGRSDDEGALTIGQRLALVASDLGPTFIKLAQMLTTRPDILPADVLAELQSLQDDVPPFPTTEAMAIIVEELQRPVAECFASIEGTPLASGSIGQVYRATSLDGESLIVKVRRPDVERIIDGDMQLLRWIADSLERLVPETRIYRPRVLVEEFEQVIKRELDYINEASVTSRLADAFSETEGIQIPRVKWSLTGPRVFTMTALSGVNVETILGGGGASVDRPLVARRLMEAYLTQVFDVGLFHADPHPGNVLVTPSGTIGLVDFGQSGTIPDDMMDHLVVIVYASVTKEIDVIIDTLADMGALGAATERRELHRSLRVLLDKYYGLPIKRLDISTLISEFSDVMRRHDVLAPRDVVVLVKALGMVFSLAARLDPELDVLELLKPKIKRKLLERLDPSRLLRSAAVSGWNVLGILRNAPGQLREALRRLSAGSWQLNVRHENMDRLIDEVDRSSNRLAFSIVTAAIIIGSSVVISTSTDVQLLGIPVQYFGVVGYLVAGMLGLGLSWAIFRSGRLH